MFSEIFVPLGLIRWDEVRFHGLNYVITKSNNLNGIKSTSFLFFSKKVLPLGGIKTLKGNNQFGQLIILLC
jgi:hypothetical protein